MTSPDPGGGGGEARQALRQVRSVALQRVLLMATGVAFVALLPRWMGPRVYGQFSLIQSMTLWFTAFSGLGAISMMTRFVPEFVLRGDGAGLRRLASGLLFLRVAGGAALGLGFVAVLRLWLGDLPALATLLAGGVVAVRTVANLPYTLLLGLNQAGRWESGDLLRRLAGLGLAMAGFSALGLAGAIAGLLGAELLVLSVGLVWTRAYFHWRQLRPDIAYLRPFLAFGAAFFGSNLLIMLFQHSGAAVVKAISGNYEQAGYYSLAFHLYLTATQSLWRLLCTLGPLLAGLHAGQKHEELRQWTERLLSALGVASVLGCAALAVLGAPLIRVIAGPEYDAAGALMPWLALATLVFIPGGVARLLAIACGRPSATMGSAVAQTAAFAAGCLLWVPPHGALGACLATVAAASAFAFVGTWRMRQESDYSLRGWGKAVVAGAVCAPLLWPGYGVSAGMRLVVFAVVFGALVWLLGLVHWRDWADLWRHGRVRSGGGPTPA
ncbi:MAG: lipopolysaccharide biosynthesis protein [Bryobacterales bacterium]|nr:lipopolysaccharide biosynthesis protein [Bryobacterales bacterium]